MDSLYLLIPIALIFVIIVAALLIWSINRGQYDDLDQDAWRALNDDLTSNPPQEGDHDRH
ncbi:MAG: cbb3-type cytochrome oxidase assembly protein CcoS [Luminiphilus sp.]|nr:cbb3-type cytochrome oxidase assembly protein CcoS [Luminiphilus sp.]MDG1460803.1 cbb3-type cytochrome oxidase assembly protein CcoS [Luminiphilus sp.]